MTAAAVGWHACMYADRGRGGSKKRREVNCTE